jgi:hypothetical protein
MTRPNSRNQANASVTVTFDKKDARDSGLFPTHILLFSLSVSAIIE